MFLVTFQFALTLISPESMWKVVLNNCRVEDWTTTYDPTRVKTAFPWCESSDRDKQDRISSLMLSMRRYSPKDVRLVSAVSFGSNVQVYYMPEIDEFMINPKIVENTGKRKWYQCGTLRPPLSTRLRVSYLNGGFEPTTKEFTNVNAQTIECETTTIHSESSSL